ncbi:MAG TPA: hypothetical protein VGH28_33390 [Polyangiaceae bacterium]
MRTLALLAFISVVSCGGAATQEHVTLTPTTSATAPRTSASALPPPATTAAPAACKRPLAGTSICFEGGQGASKQDAIVIKGARGESDGVAAEYKYLEDLYGPRGQGYTVDGQSLLDDAGKSFDRLDIKVSGQPKAVYFDITDYFGKF